MTHDPPGTRTVPSGRPQPLLPGDPEWVGPWELLARLGGGGMGTIYLARSRTSGSSGAAGGTDAGSPPGPLNVAALKVVHRSRAAEPEPRDRFRVEVRALRAALASGTGTPGRSFAALLGADTEGEMPWLATEYLPALALQQAVDNHGPWQPEAIRRLGAALAEALASLHTAGVLHRDIKPSNILVTQDGPRVIDFGIAQDVGWDPGRPTSTGDGPTRPGEVAGSPGYLAPERAGGEPATAAGDVFGVAAVLAFAASGRAPFGSGTAEELQFRMVHREPDTVGLDGQLRDLVVRALSPDSEDRPSADELARELAELPEPSPPLDRPLHTADGAAVWLFPVLPEPVRAELTAGPETDWTTAAPLRSPEPLAPVGSSPVAVPAEQAPRRRAVLLAGGAALLVGAAGFGSYLAGRAVRGAEEPPGPAADGEPGVEAHTDAPGSEVGAEWVYEGPMNTYGHLAAADGVVVLPPEVNTEMIALGRVDGEEQWSGPRTIGSRPMVTPDGATILVTGIPQGAPDQIGLLDAGTGRATPSVSLGMRVLNMRQTPVIAFDDRIAFLAGFRTDEPIGWLESDEVPRGLVAYDIDADEVVWERDIPPVPGTMVVGAVSGDLLIVLGTDLATAYRTSDGEEVWERRLGEELVSADMVDETPERRLATDGAGGVVITGRGVLYLDGATGETHWSVEPDSVPGLSEEAGNHGITALYGEPAVADGIVYLAESRYGVRALELESMETVWHWESEDLLDMIPAGCVVAGGLVFPPIGVGNTIMIALDAETGEVVWRLEDTGFSSNGSHVVADEGQLYLRRDNTVRAMPLEGGEDVIKSS